jgi:hypothetical protein
LKPASEAGFLKAVLDYAALRQWRCYHCRPARTTKGWRTAAQGNGAKGFPDCVFVRAGRIVFAELKMPRGKLSADQLLWLDALRQTPFEVYVWNPADSWPEIEDVLR